MDIGLWIVQGILAAMFLMVGIMKMSQSKEVLIEKVGGWVESYDLNKIRMIGFVELLGALGIILPQAFDLMPFFVPISAAGLGLTMIAAFWIHLQRKENKESMVNVFLFAMTVFVFVGRIDFL